MEKLRTSVLHHTVTPPSVELSGLKNPPRHDGQTAAAAAVTSGPTQGQQGLPTHTGAFSTYTHTA